MVKFNKVNEIYNASSNSNNLNNIFEHLKVLNNVLHNELKDSLISLCHVGAIDNDHKVVVIFVSNSQILHIIKSMSSKLLHTFYLHGYSFDSLLVKVSIKDPVTTIRRHHLDHSLKDKLSQLAIAIGKPEIIIDEIEYQADENDIIL